MRFVCPECKGSLHAAPASYSCPACAREYPVISGIPDFRLYPDPYISIPDDRRKGELLAQAGRGRSFADLVRYYYSITPEVPADHAERWLAHAVAQVDIARSTLGSLAGSGGALLDLGCSTGGLLIAASGDHQTVTGVDVAFRWLVVAQRRMQEMGVTAELVCANAEALPFADAQFHTVTAVDVLEHVRDAQASLCEASRVSAPGARMLCATNNRYAPLPDPQVGIWGVGYFPRRWQAPYVAWRRRGLHVYHVRMCSASEMDRMFHRAGYEHFATTAAPLFAPHLANGSLQRVLGIYNRLRELPLVRNALRWAAPRIMTLAER